MENAYEHAPAGACFPVDEMRYDVGAIHLAGLDALFEKLEREEIEALSAHDDKKVARLRQRQHAVGLARETLETAMNEAAAEYVPSKEDRAEQQDEERGDMAREDRSAA